MSKQQYNKLALSIEHPIIAMDVRQIHSLHSVLTSTHVERLKVRSAEGFSIFSITSKWVHRCICFQLYDASVIKSHVLLHICLKVLFYGLFHTTRYRMRSRKLSKDFFTIYNSFHTLLTPPFVIKTEANHLNRNSLQNSLIILTNLNFFLLSFLTLFSFPCYFNINLDSEETIYSIYSIFQLCLGSILLTISLQNIDFA